MQYAKLALGFGLFLGTAACSQAGEQVPAASESASAAAKAKGAADAKVPEVIKVLQRQGFDLVGQFDAPGGLRGFAGVAANQPVAAYLTPDGQHAVVGMLVDAQGKDVAGPILDRIVAKPMSERTWSELGKSAWIADGKADAPRIIYTFSDANCPYCHRFWEAARPWVDAGKVQLRHILVGVIREDSANKAAAIFKAKNPSQALLLSEQRFSSGGIQGLPSVPDDVRAKLAANEQLMMKLGFQGTPGILFRGADGVVHRRSGLPQGTDLDTVLGPR